MSSETTDPGLLAYQLAELRDSRKDHESRLRHLERWMFAIAGSGAIAGGLLGRLAEILIGG